MSRRPSYEVTAYRSGKWWALEAPRVRGALSQCRRLDQAETMIREAIATVLDVRDDSFDISLDVQLPGDVRRLVDGVADARAQQEVADQAARRAMQATAASSSRVTTSRQGMPASSWASPISASAR